MVPPPANVGAFQPHLGRGLGAGRCLGPSLVAVAEHPGEIPEVDEEQDGEGAEDDPQRDVTPGPGVDREPRAEDNAGRDQDAVEADQRGAARQGTSAAGRKVAAVLAVPPPQKKNQNADSNQERHHDQ